ncbi:13441_t:CDS:2, partial [Funneliformis geosporum]
MSDSENETINETASTKNSRSEGSDTYINLVYDSNIKDDTEDFDIISNDEYIPLGQNHIRGRAQTIYSTELNLDNISNVEYLQPVNINCLQQKVHYNGHGKNEAEILVQDLYNNAKNDLPPKE